MKRLIIVLLTFVLTFFLIPTIVLADNPIGTLTTSISYSDSNYQVNGSASATKSEKYKTAHLHVVLYSDNNPTANGYYNNSPVTENAYIDNRGYTMSCSASCSYSNRNVVNLQIGKAKVTATFTHGAGSLSRTSYIW